MGSVQDKEKRLRDFRERFEEERKGQQAGCISQGRLGTFPKVIFCVKLLIFIVVVGVRIVWIHTIRTKRKRAGFLRFFVGTKFEVD